jgi:hypothetical protein
MGDVTPRIFALADHAAVSPGDGKLYKRRGYYQAVASGYPGLDDFVAARGREAFLDLVDEAEPWGSIGMVKRLQAEIRELRAQLSAQAELLRNPSMRERDKVVAIATINEAGWRKSMGTPTPFVVYRERIADAVGLKPDAVGQSLTRLSSEGSLFTKQVTPTWNEQGEARSVIKLAPRQDGGVVDLIRHATHFEPEYEGVRGGRRLQCCPEHLGADMVRRVTVVCTECGQLVHDRTETLKPQNHVSDMIDDDPFEQKSQTDGSARVTDMLEHLERQLEVVGGGPGLRGFAAAPISDVSVRPFERSGEQACRACGAFADDRSGPVRLVGGVWLHDECRVRGPLSGETAAG